LSFVLTAAAIIFRDVGLVCVILLFLWRHGETISRIGWAWTRPGRELIIGAVCFLPVFPATLLGRVLLGVGLSPPATPLPSFLNDKGPAEALLAVLLVTAVALAEETIFRGYLLLRFQSILESATVSELLSSVIFALGHRYEGTAGLVTVGVMGAAFAVVYLWRGSLVAPIVMDFLRDFLSVVLLPLLGLK
jgi:uncharacterized protein